MVLINGNRIVLKYARSKMIRLVKLISAIADAYYIEDWNGSEWKLFQSFTWDGEDDKREVAKMAYEEFAKLDTQILDRQKVRNLSIIER